MQRDQNRQINFENKGKLEGIILPDIKTTKKLPVNLQELRQCSIYVKTDKQMNRLESRIQKSTHMYIVQKFFDKDAKTIQ